MLNYKEWQAPHLERQWRVYTEDGFLMNLSASFEEVGILMGTYKCAVDMQYHVIDLL